MDALNTSRRISVVARIDGTSQNLVTLHFKSLIRLFFHRLKIVVGVQLSVASIAFAYHIGNDNVLIREIALETIDENKQILANRFYQVKKAVICALTTR